MLPSANRAQKYKVLLESGTINQKFIRMILHIIIVLVIKIETTNLLSITRTLSIYLSRYMDSQIDRWARPHGCCEDHEGAALVIYQYYYQIKSEKESSNLTNKRISTYCE
jgi:hypothetical protein